MSEGRPRLSVGLPVYNGQRFLATAIASVLDGSFGDVELIVSDNGSTDDTEAIVRSFAERDGRIRYIRHATNIGPVANFNSVFRAARGEYFKWLAYDDVCGPDFLARCIEVLDRDPSVVLCSARYVEIDEHGEPVADQPYDLDLTSDRPHERLAELMCTARGHPILFGVIRTDTVRRTHLLAPYHGSDRAFLAELTLHGRLHEIPEILWSSRDHPDRSPYVRRASGWDPKWRRALPPHLASLVHMIRILATAPIGRVERLRCLAALVRCLGRRSRTLAPAVAGELADVARGILHRG